MHPFWIEGLYLTRRGVKKAGKTGRTPPGEIEPYAKTIWASSAEEALKLASEELDGGRWLEGPRVGSKSEESRMRSLGMPELPGLEAPKKKKPRRPR